MKFAHKLFLALILTALMTILPLGCFSYSQARKTLLGQAEQSVKEQVWQSGLMLDSRIEQCQSVINSILYNAQLQQCLNTENISYFQQYLMFEDIMEPTIENIIGSHSSITQLKIFTDNETLKGHSRYLYDLAGLSSETGAGGKRAALHYQATAETLTVIVPFPSYGTGITNVLWLDVRISDILSLLVTDERELRILDEFGEIVYESTGMKNCAAGIPETDGGEIVLNAKNYLIFTNEISAAGWKTVCLIPRDTLVINDFSILNATVLILLAAVLICMAMSAMLCRVLLNPVKRLYENIQEIKRENFDLVIHSDSEDEIGQLTNAFGDMTKRLNFLINEVYRSQIKQKDAQFKMLQAQLNPHFLYNTLSYINWSALRAGAKDIAKISRDISSFYRTALNGGDATVTIADELLNAQSYVNIQLALHHDSFDVVYEVEKECEDLVIICNLLQPLIENALEHGIDRKRDGRGRLRISVCRKGEEVILSVMDNGPGFEKEMERRAVSQESSGYGLKNVNDRIRIFYGEKYGITIYSKSGEETRIEIRVPVRKKGDKNETKMDGEGNMGLVHEP